MKNTICISLLFLLLRSVSAQVGAHIENGSQITNDSSYSGNLILGPVSGTNIALDGNDIQTRSDNMPGGLLYVNRYAGDISMLAAGSVGQLYLGGTTGNHKLTLNVTGNDGLTINGDGSGNARLRIYNGNGNHFLYDDSAASNVLKLQSASGLSFVVNGADEIMKITPSQKVIVGETIELLHNGPNDGGEIKIKNSAGSDRIKLFATPTGTNFGGFMSMFNDNDDRTVLIEAEDSQKGGKIQLSDSTGTISIKLDSDWNGSGDSRIVTDEIQIEGGSDLAERFDLTNPVEEIVPGSLVSLDPKNSGKLMISNQAYDRKIVGIVSGANGIKPGILMGQAGSEAYGDQLITLSGRTYVKANTTNGEIRIGDFLTSSDVSGEAMKASRKKKSRGAIIGKAMSSLKAGEGFILVLVNLQ